MSKRNVEAIFPLSPMQQGMVFHSIYSPGKTTYVGVFAARIKGVIDIRNLMRAWSSVVDRYSPLRTSFVWKRLDRMLQVVHKEVDPSIELLDWRLHPSANVLGEIEEYIKEKRNKGFDLSKPPLIKLSVIHIEDNEYEFIWFTHHAILDGWSIPIIFKDLFAFYDVYTNQKDISISPERPYREYIQWLQRQDIQEAKSFWKEKLSGFEETTQIPYMLSEGVSDSEVQNEEIELFLSDKESEDLIQFAHKNKLTLNSILQSAWAMVLGRLTGEEDVVFGITVSGRPAEIIGVEQMVGLFINTLPIRIKLDPNAKVIEWIKKIQADFSEIRQYESSPLFEVQEWSDINPGTPLFDSILVFENYPVDKSIREQSLDFDIVDFRSKEETNYPLTIISSPGDRIPIKISFNPERFSREDIESLIERIFLVIKGILSYSTRNLSEIKLLSEDEEKLIVFDWNDTDKKNSFSGCIHQLFENQVVKYPDNIAIKSFEGEFSYREINQKSNQLARFIQSRNLEPESRIGICVDRSATMVVALLGILKSGCAYIPIDPKFPTDRIKFMLVEGGAKLLITTSSKSEEISVPDLDVILLDRDDPLIKEEDNTNLDLVIADGNLAYIVFTSGSTGQPKGVMVEHRSLLNLIQYQINNYQLSTADKVSQFLSFSFDAAGEEIYPTICSGATLILVYQDLGLSIKPFLDFCETNEVSVLHLVPSFWHEMVREMEENNYPPPKDLRVTVVGGESPSLDRLNSWRRIMEKSKIYDNSFFINTYGPTETTITAIDFKVSSSTEIEGRTIPIGKPINNAKVYVLDNFMQPVPVGVPGELYISGSGVSRGYINSSATTQQKFLDNPFLPGLRMYRTGDVVKYLHDGNLEFLGRQDDQVKIRGYRIELGEIETTLLSEANIQTGVVVVKGDEINKKIVAYVVPRNGHEIDAEVVKKRLGKKLPDFMIPSHIVQMDTLPKTSSGKIDFRRLPELENILTDEKGQALKNPTEELLASIWKKILDVKTVSAQDNFVQLGGHSLLITQLNSRIRDIFHVEVPLKDIFEAKSLAEMAEFIETSKRNSMGLDSSPIMPQERNDTIPLSFAQQRLWFLEQLSPGNLFYNIPIALELSGEIDEDVITWCLNQIVIRHEILRTRFDVVSGKPAQIIEEEKSLEIPVIDLVDLSESEQRAQLNQFITDEVSTPFDLACGPLIRAKFIRTGSGSAIFLFSMHHIITDGWSIEVMVRELAELYEIRKIAEEGTDIIASLPDLSIQYADFAIWQRSWLEGENLQKQLNYWSEKLAGRPQILNLPADHPRPAIQSSNGASIRFSIQDSVSEGLKKISTENSVTLFITLLAVYQILLSRYSGQNDILVGTPIANRTRSEIESLIGFFVNTLVIRSDLSQNLNFIDLLKQVRDTAVEAYAHQDLPFELLVESLHPDRDLSHSPIFQAAFSLQAKTSQKLQLPGLSIEPIDLEASTSKFDLTLVVAETDTDLSGTLEYNTDLFERKTMERLVGHYQVLLEGVVKNCEENIFALNLLTEKERETVLFNWNETAEFPPSDLCIHELFERQVQENPDVIAVSFEGNSLTYKELNEKANQLANYLLEQKVQKELIVGVSTERSSNMIIGVLGILKAGGAYLPLDPSYPVDRLEFMVKDSGITLLLSQSDLKPVLPETEIRHFWFDRDWEVINKYSDNKPEVKVESDNLAYVIYTSGSTGKPKGTMLNHRGLSNLVEVQRNAFNIRIGSKILQFSPYSFDASVWEIFMALANGGTLCIVKQEILTSTDELIEVLEKENITNVTLPPSVIRVLPERDLPFLETIIAAGEACTPELVNRWGKGRQFVNAYGPTETTVCASMYFCSHEDPNPPPIGRPIANTRLYILDSHLQPQPIGIPGELHVSGINLARGYLNRSEITNEKFIHNPFSPGNRMYKTGDLVKYLPDGNIVFLGRIDQQVKLRGFRIELGEIENTLNQHSAIKESVVIVRDEIGHQILNAYLVLEENQTISINEVKDHVRKFLPEYMVPTTVIFMHEFPLSPSGKIERNLLPAPSDSDRGVKTEFIAPRNQLEEQLTTLCSELLGVEKIGVYDNFFELGGHSLLATQFISRVREDLTIEIPLRVLFEFPTIAGLTEQIHLLRVDEETEEDRIIRLLQQINGLSDEDVQSMIEEKKKEITERNIAE